MRHAPLFLLPLMLGACSLAPDYQRPAAPVPAAWPEGVAYAEQAEAAPPGLSWRELIAHEKLRTVIGQMLENNRDLRAALANVEVARAQYRVQRSARLPTIAANGGVTVSDSNNGSRIEGGRGNRDTWYSANLGVSAFEIDLFGRVRNLSQAALESYLATEEGARATRIALIAETASAYATLAADMELLRVAQETLANAERALKLTQDLNRAGLAGKLDVHQAETVVQQARADVENYLTQVAQDRNALNLLAGATVDEALLPETLAELAETINPVPAGLSSEVLLNRPDVLAAEHTLKAANANIGAARAAFFPRISLTAAAGFASGALDSLFDGDNFTWQVNPAASMALLGGPNWANLAASKAQRDRAIAQYEGAIQTAFREVADALARAGTIVRQQEAQRALLRASEQSYALAEQRYKAGIDPFLNTLDAQRTLYAARRSVIATDLAFIANRIEMYRAIGAEPAS